MILSPSRAVLPGLVAAYLVAAASCGEVNVRDGLLASLETCQDIQGRFHFRVLVPPWKYDKEYLCSQWESGQCLGTWSPTGRYVFVVSDEPFVNFDSEIVTSLDVEVVSGDTASLANQLIATEQITTGGTSAIFWGEDAYPRAVTGAPESGELSGHEVLWQQSRSYQGQTYDWYRRDVYLVSGGTVFHLRFFSIDRLDNPEFQALVRTFRPGAAEDGAPACPCRDEHDPAGETDC